MTRKVGLIKVTCGKCGFVNFVPFIDGEIALETTAKCEQCRSIIVQIEKSGRFDEISRRLRAIFHR